MKVSRFRASGVHGYLRIEVEFFPDLTFLTGLNGSGKTSALRLLMALLTPRIEEFATIEFERAEVVVSDAGRDSVITASRTTDGICVEVTGIADTLMVTNAELHLLSEPRRPDEARSPIHEKIARSVVFEAIRAMSTPMFLGLDRRYLLSAIASDDYDMRRRELTMRRYLQEELCITGVGAASLVDVNHLVSQRLQEIRAAQESLDETLRRRFLTKAFEYKPTDIHIGRLPTRQELDRYRERLAHIERAAEGLRLPVPELTAELSAFFTKMTAIVDALEQGTKKHSKKRQPDREFVEWLINKPQADRILEHIRLLDEYGSERGRVHEPMDRFMALVNGFLVQTRKRVAISARGELHVYLEDQDGARTTGALSSGERQLVIMLAHLSLNRSLAASGVFIVDEPELSLHIEWQERFVDAVRQANPNVQLILATHSPAIILDRIDHCRSLS